MERVLKVNYNCFGNQPFESFGLESGVWLKAHHHLVLVIITFWLDGSNCGFWLIATTRWTNKTTTTTTPTYTPYSGWSLLLKCDTNNLGLPCRFTAILHSTTIHQKTGLLVVTENVQPKKMPASKAFPW